MTKKEILSKIIERAEQRNRYYLILLRLVDICLMRNFRLIIENPYSVNGYLYNNFPYKPEIIDVDRTKKGDRFRKPTQYFFINCKPETTYNSLYQKYKAKKIRSLSGHKGGMCSKERSEITPEYAYNFVCDYILNKKTEYTEKTLFNYAN